MSKEKCRIGVVAPASRMSPDVAVRVPALAGRIYPDRTPEISVFHPQCLASHGHFAGDNEARAQAFIDIANDESTTRCGSRAAVTAPAAWSRRS